MLLHNKYDKELLRKRLMEESFRRVTLSFYRYVFIPNVEIFRDHLYVSLSELNVFGRIYLAHEGINAQISVPEPQFKAFENLVDENLKLRGVPFKIAVEDNGKSFYKLIVRIRKKIVADGLGDFDFDPGNVGRHLNAEEFNREMESGNAVVIDMRNHYESEVGHFENALCPDADTFRDALPKALDMAHGKQDQKILLYCTGGIRCEKASAYFRHHGFKNVSQLYGGIIAYAREVHEKKLESKFRGKNFVFDDRLGERITPEIISQCHQCGHPCDDHTNCANPECHLLFIQCKNCREEMNGCCSPRCREIIKLPVEEQRKIRKGQLKNGDQRNIFKSRLRPDLRQILKQAE